MQFQKIKDLKLGGSKPTKRQKIIMKAMWLISTARNALMVLASSFLAYMLHTPEKESAFILTGMFSGLPFF